MTELWQTTWEPLPDITAYELALDRKFVNASDIVLARVCDDLGTTLRHRMCAGRRMDEIWRDVKS
jgi:hypothetical protein